MPPPPRAPRRRLSVVRVSVVLLVVAAAVTWFGGGFRGSSSSAAGATGSWFAPYVDVTATPTYAFEDPTVPAHGAAVLGFVVSSPTAACQPSWGGAYLLDAAAGQLDLDRRVARLKQLGGRVTVSFGGAANSELGIGCTDVAQLTAAYRSVIDRYSATSIDFDIEGAAASESAVAGRRAAATAAVLAQESAAGRTVGVWLTLPVGPSGLTDQGSTVLAAMLAAKVPVAGVNGMTMDYGVPRPAGRSMADEGELALTALQQQVRSAYATAGTKLSDDQAWQRVGATAMIGQNDIASEVFTLADARQLVAFADQHRMARLSMWSANRDQGCGPNYPDVQIVSDGCSGVPQDAGEYSAIFQTFGQAPVAGTAVTTITSAATSSANLSVVAIAVVDDPATSPYAIWNINQAYPKDTKIVWHRNVYQAKWYSQGDQPDAPVTSADLTPWTLIGPVLPGEHPVATPTVAAGTYPQWNAASVYQGGSRVMLGGVGYQAKWWTQGEPPGRTPTSPADVSPWALITTP
jgi:chitinase